MFTKNIGYIFISPVEDRMTGLASYTKSLLIELSAQANETRDVKIHVLTNSKEIINFIKSDKNLNHSVLLNECRKPKYIPYKIWCLWMHISYNLSSPFFRRNLIISTTPWGSPIQVTPQIITIHDLYDLNPNYRPKRTILFSKLMYSALGKVGANFICVSETTNEAVKNQLPFIEERKKTVILEASKFTPANISKEATVDQYPNPYFLFVANLQTNKNPTVIWDAMKVITAHSNWSIKWIGWDEQGLISKYEIERREKISDRFISLGRVSDKELSVLYSGALALIVASLDEGFCLPIVEAHSHSCPVIASDIPILREVAGNGANFFDPNNSKELAGILQEFIENPQIRKNFSLQAKQNSARFSWKNTAQQTLNYAGKVLARAQ